MHKIHISMGFCAGICILAWANPYICLWFLVSALLHELGHLLLMALLDVPVYGLTLRLGGAQIWTGSVSLGRELLCTLAGPFVNLLLGVLVYDVQRQLALVSLGLAAFNLLPIYPLDGGRAAFCLLQRVLPPGQAERAASLLQKLVCAALMVAVCWAAIRLQAGLWPIFAALLLLWRTGNQEKLLQFLRNDAKMKKPE